MTHPDDTPHPAAPDTDVLSDEARRDALRKLGTLAAWSAPVMLTLLTSARADDFGSPTMPP